MVSDSSSIALIRKERLLILALLLANISHVLDFVVMIPLGPMLMRELDITALTYGNIVSVYTFASAISAFISTMWIDRINRKSALTVLLIGFSIGNVVCFWAPTAGVLSLGRAIAGLFGGVINAVVYAFVGQLISIERRGRATGILAMAFPLVSIVGVPIGLKLATTFGWRSVFIFVLIMTFLSLLIALFVLPSLEPEKDYLASINPFSQVRGLLTEPAHVWGLVLIFFTVMGGFIIIPYIAPFLVSNGFLLEDDLYLVYLVGGFCAIASSRIFGVFADRFGKINILRVTVVLTMIMLAYFTSLPPMALALVLVVSSLLMMFLPARFVCVMAWMTIVVKPNKRGAYMSLVVTLQSITIGVATIVGGLLVGERSDGSLGTYYYAGAVAIFFNILILLISPKLKRFELTLK